VILANLYVKGECVANVQFPVRPKKSAIVHLREKRYAVSKQWWEFPTGGGEAVLGIGLLEQ